MFLKTLQKRWRKREDGIRPMKLANVKILFVLVLTAWMSVGVIAEEAPPSTQPAKESAALVEQLKKLLGRQDLADVVQQTKVPTAAQSTDDSAGVAGIIDQVRVSAPELLQSTSDQEKKYAAGQWDEAGARKRIDQTILVFRDFKTLWPPVTMRLLQLYGDKKLSGAELELAARIFEVHLKELEASIVPDKYPKRTPICI
jgi:hypothetical protein